MKVLRICELPIAYCLLPILGRNPVSQVGVTPQLTGYPSIFAQIK